MGLPGRGGVSEEDINYRLVFFICNHAGEARHRHVSREEPSRRRSGCPEEVCVAKPLQKEMETPLISPEFDDIDKDRGKGELADTGLHSCD